MRNENIEAVLRDEIVMGRELEKAPGQNQGKYPLFGLRRGPVVIGERNSS